MPFFGGLIIDVIGVRKGIFIFTLFPILGQGLIVWSSLVKNFELMMFGRVILGFGGDTILVAQATMISKWFEDD